MSSTPPKIKIYNPVVDELRPVNTPAERKAWEERMRKECARSDIKITQDMHLLDTCCGGRADDCGQML